jgi:hypothetical protein
MMFPNKIPETLRIELKLAARLGVKPVKIGESGFDAVVEEGRIKWAVKTNGELVIIPHTLRGQEIFHSVLTGGEPVIAAGEAEIVGSRHMGRYILLQISNRSGHFQPSADSLEIGIEAFRKQGIDTTSAIKEIEGQ